MFFPNVCDCLKQTKHELRILLLASRHSLGIHEKLRKYLSCLGKVLHITLFIARLSQRVRGGWGGGIWGRAINI